MNPPTARRAAVAALLAGVAADVLFDRVSLGINVPIATAALLAVVTWLAPARRPADPLDWWLPAVALGASVWLAIRTDPSVVPLDLVLVLLATGAWSVAVSGVAVTRRAASAIAVLGVQASLVALVALGWLLCRSGADGFLSRGSHTLGRLAPIARGVLIALPVLAGFSLLLSSADAVFGRALDDALSLPVDVGDVAGRGLFGALAAWLVAGPIGLAVGARDTVAELGHMGESRGSGTPAADTPHPVLPEPIWRRRTGATETLVVLAAVDALFAAFAVVQVVFLFGGADTLVAIGMTYSDYARQGYFQLVGVVALAGMLLVGAHEVVGRTRALLAGSHVLLILTAVILASAAFRLALYQGAYGWTELRFFVGASIAWLAVCIISAAALLAADRMRWLPHLLAGGAIAVTLAASVVGPQAFVTRENLARVLNPGLVAPGGYAGFDTDYILQLGDDAIPDLVAALAYLPPADRASVMPRLRLRQQQLRLDPTTQSPFAWNLARERARAALAELPGR